MDPYNQNPQQTYPPQTPQPQQQNNGADYGYGYGYQQPQQNQQYPPQQPQQQYNPYDQQPAQYGAYTQQPQQQFSQQPQTPQQNQQSINPNNVFEQAGVKKVKDVSPAVKLIKKYAPFAVGGLIALLVIINLAVQLIYPYTSIAPGVAVNGVAVGGLSKEDATARLNEAYNAVEANMYIGSASVPFMTSNIGAMGIRVNNNARLDGLTYPLWMRFIPTSIFWVGGTVTTNDPVYDSDKAAIDKFVIESVGDDCKISAKNASLKVDDGRFVVVAAEPGGVCSSAEFKKSIQDARIGDDGKVTIRLNVKEVVPPLTDAIAKQRADELNYRLRVDMPIKAAGKTTSVPHSIVKSWLTFVPRIPKDLTKEKPQLIVKVDRQRFNDYAKGQLAPKVEKKPGVTKISTSDNKVKSRTNGARGVVLDTPKTITTIEAYISSRRSAAQAVTKATPPEVQYTRAYTGTPRGFEALIKQFDQDHAGSFAIVAHEVSGKKPRYHGEYNATKKFKTGGLEGAYLAYVAYERVESGAIQPTDQISGSTTFIECARAAIEKQDQECITALIEKIGNETVQAKLRAFGLKNTSFKSADVTTTAKDAYVFMTKVLDAKSLKKYKSEMRSAMRESILRDGVKAGAGGNVFSFAGATDTVYNEAAEVNFKGRYRIVVLSSGSNAETTKKLIQEIEKLRVKRVDD